MKISVIVQQIKITMFHLLRLLIHSFHCIYVNH